MNLTKKKMGLFFLIAAVIFFITAGYIKKNNEKVIPVKQVEPVAVEKKNIQKEVPVKASRKEKFKSNDEIKKEYGKIETVYLWNGKKYTGAVITTDELYTIITVDGVVKIPMKDVKIREIIR